MLIYSKPSYLLNAINNHFLFSSRPCLYFSALRLQNPSSKPHFMVDYLINSCGFSIDQANKASDHLTHLKSHSNPESVLRFLKQCGFSDTHITEIVSKHPRLLCSDVEKTLKPKFNAFQEMGFSQSEIIELVCSCPLSFSYSGLRSKIEFLRSLSLSNENIQKAFRKNHSFFGASIAKRIMPNVSLLRKYGIPDDRIGKMVMNSPWFLGRSLVFLDNAIKRTEELGVSRWSGMFCHVLRHIACTSRATFNAKINLFESLGWSKEEFIAALGKSPGIISHSEKSIRDKMDFLVKEAGLELSYVVRRPVLFLYSLEKNLVPRHSVLKVLEKEGLLRRRPDFLTVIVLSKGNFVKKFVLPHKNDVPELHDAYLAACTGKSSMLSS